MARLALPGRSPAIRPTSRSCTASPASAACPSSSSTGCRATRAPRRCGSATPRREQVQLDVYGEVIDALYTGRVHGLRGDPTTPGSSRGTCSASSSGLATARRRDLGGARPEPPLHPLEGDGVGGVRPRRPHGRGAWDSRAGRPLARGARRDPRGGVRAGLRRRSSARSPSLRVEAARRERAAHPARRLPAARTTRGCSARSRRSAGRSSATGSIAALPGTTRRMPRSTDCRRARASSCRARSGTSTTSR